MSQIVHFLSILFDLEIVLLAGLQILGAGRHLNVQIKHSF